ncbi:serine/threonine protein kinase [Mortierella sp. GBA35]|nr:serine/threonine protein kinase [Mortierella sp. GBA35]
MVLTPPPPVPTRTISLRPATPNDTAQDPPTHAATASAVRLQPTTKTAEPAPTTKTAKPNLFTAAAAGARETTSKIGPATVIGPHRKSHMEIWWRTRNTDTGDVYKWIDTIASIQKRAQSHQQNVDVLERIDNGHEGIIRYYDQFEYMGHYCLRLDLAQTNLLQHRKENPGMNKSDMISCIRQVAEGIEYLHSIRILHRDIKNENILITADGKTKITDLGICTFLTKTPEEEDEDVDEEDDPNQTSEETAAKWNRCLKPQGTVPYWAPKLSSMAIRQTCAPLEPSPDSSSTAISHR